MTYLKISFGAWGLHYENAEYNSDIIIMIVIIYYSNYNNDNISYIDCYNALHYNYDFFIML